MTGVYHLHCGRVDEAIAAAERTLEHGANSPYDAGAAGDLLSMAGDAERGQAAIDRALAVNPRLPGFV